MDARAMDCAGDVKGIAKKISQFNYSKESFCKEYCRYLQNSVIECDDAVNVVERYDNEDAFFYVDPPYFNSDCRPYAGYTADDFEFLLKTLSKIKGKFLLSSYPSDVLDEYTLKNDWRVKTFAMHCPIRIKCGKDKKNIKTEVLTYNYEITTDFTLFHKECINEQQNYA
jgi:DNA adenine methylase